MFLNEYYVMVTTELFKIRWSLFNAMHIVCGNFKAYGVCHSSQVLVSTFKFPISENNTCKPQVGIHNNSMMLSLNTVPL